jgi:hypothetical protein
MVESLSESCVSNGSRLGRRQQFLGGWRSMSRKRADWPLAKTERVAKHLHQPGVELVKYIEGQPE